MHSEVAAPSESTKPALTKGLHLVTAEHRRRWEEGLLSLREIAEEVGVRKQSVHALAKRQGWRRRSAEPAAPKAGQTSEQAAASESKWNNGQEQLRSADAAKGVEKDPTTIELPRVVDQLATATAARDLSDLQLRIRQAFIQLQLHMIQEVTAYLVRERGKHGPQALRAISAIIARSQNQLAALGVVGADDAAELPAKLEVRVYTPEEEAEIQGKVEQDAATVRGQRTSDPAAPEGRDPGPKPDEMTGPSQVDRSRSALICEPLPDVSAFRDWLVMLGHRYGARHLRDISTVLGGAAHRDQEALVNEIFRVTNGDPQRLGPLLKSAA